MSPLSADFTNATSSSTMDTTDNRSSFSTETSYRDNTVEESLDLTSVTSVTHQESTLDLIEDTTTTELTTLLCKEIHFFLLKVIVIVV
jgi:hypothetical protein